MRDSILRGDVSVSLNNIGCYRWGTGETLTRLVRHLNGHEGNTMNHPVNSPDHYVKNTCGFEPIEATEHMSLSLGSAFAYIFRAKQKGTYVQDMRKAQWYLQREAARVEMFEVHYREQDRLGVNVLEDILHEATFDENDYEQTICKSLLICCTSSRSWQETVRHLKQMHALIARHLSTQYKAGLIDLNPVSEEFQRVASGEASVGALGLVDELTRNTVRLNGHCGVVSVMLLGVQDDARSALKDNEYDQFRFAIGDIIRDTAVLCSVFGWDYAAMLREEMQSLRE